MAERTWVWRFDASPAAVWEVMADTARFNEAAGFAKHRIEERVAPGGHVRYHAEGRIGPFAARWEEIPVEWIAGQRFTHRREFRDGPLRSMVASLALFPENGGTRAEYRLEVVPRGLRGRMILGPFFAGAGRVFARLVADAQGFLAGARVTPFATAPVVFDRDRRSRVDAMVAAIEATPHGHGLAARLAAELTDGSEIDLAHMRSLALARRWGVANPRHVVELCLQAVKTGLLGMEWVLLCPRCRGAKVTAPALDRLPENAHCAACNIDYGRAFHRNVELTFHPAPWLRPIPPGEFCLYGPMTTPHVKLQQTLAPGERRTLDLALPHGAYRLRTLHPGEATDVDWQSGGFPEVIAEDGHTHAGAPAPAGQVRLHNRGAHAVTIVVEARAWVAEALTAHRVTTMQSFRDLFAEEALRPGDEASIERITLMFTDLKNSTALYERVGDARAYSLVRAHFAFLAERVRAYDGAIVKTIGDAVMAVFAEPADALRAAVAVQRDIDAFNEEHGDGPGEEAARIVIKLGLHDGACVAVRLNDRLDYFGSTVNMAARLQGESRGGDIVLSPALAAVPAVAAILAPFVAKREQAAIKGFAAPVSFLRLVPEAAD